jgi:hypothetical protein
MSDDLHEFMNTESDTNDLTTENTEGENETRREAQNWG